MSEIVTTCGVSGNDDRYTRAMLSRKLNLAWLIMSLAFCPLAGAHLASELADLAARVDFGFYSEEHAVIRAARNSLAQMSGQDAMIHYYRAYAAFRSAQLMALAGQPIDRMLDECVESSTQAAKRNSAFADAWILLAACATLGTQRAPLKALLHNRRFEQSLGKAQELDVSNPRIALVRAWNTSDNPAWAGSPVQTAAAEQLQLAVDAFRTQSGGNSLPDWGGVEAIAQLAALYLQHGDVRKARDLIEESLLSVPEYSFALRLKEKLLTIE